LVVSIALLSVPAASARAAGSSCGDPASVFIDVGHTPERPGATSARAKSEYAFNRRLALDLAAALQRRPGTEVVVLNEAGKDISLAERARSIEGLQSGVLISLHHDSVQPAYLRSGIVDGRPARFSRHARGYSLFVSGSSPAFAASERLAERIGVELRIAGFTPSLHHAEPIKGENRPIVDAKLGVLRFDGLIVLKSARIPAFLLEAGVIAHPEEELDLENGQLRGRMVAALVEGLSSFCANR
jgi:N-acetylmuramoyl-L-alanine amidase